MINKLIAKIRKTNAPIVVGLDPMLSYIPEQVQTKAFLEYVISDEAKAVFESYYFDTDVE